MSDRQNEWLVETDWLAEHLDDPDVAVVDGSYHLPAAKRDPRKEYAAAHIPGALFLDIDAISDHSNPLPHMLPSAEQFSAAIRELGISNKTRVIAYDTVGMFSAARVWWMFRAMGHDNVAVLNGGLPKWQSEGRPAESGAPSRRPTGSFTARRVGPLVRDRDQVLAESKGSTAQIVDARGASRFAGEAPEPRPGLRAGHIPGSRNIPYTVLLNKDGTFKSPPQLKAIFQGAGIDFGRPVTTTCGSGVTASIVTLALALLGREDAAVYDGSWSEWGADPSLPIETGPGK